MNEIQQAKALLERDAAPFVNEAIAGEIEDNTAHWKLDSQVPGVVGLVRSNTNKALVVVYLDDEDWELDGDWEESLL